MDENTGIGIGEFSHVINRQADKRQRSIENQDWPPSEDLQKPRRLFHPLSFRFEEQLFRLSIGLFVHFHPPCFARVSSNSRNKERR